MGQAISKANPRRSHQPANASQYALHQAISHPEPPRRLTHISELIDIDQLIRQRSSPTDTPDTLFTEDPTTDDGAAPVMIQSPSGNILSPQQYLERPDRVMTLEERKNSIRSNTERRIRVHESREGLRAEALRTRALRRKSSDEGRSNTERLIRVQESREGLRAEAFRTGALRRKSSDEGRDMEDVFVLAQEPVGQDLAEKERFNPKRKPKKRRLSCLNFCWSH